MAKELNITQPALSKYERGKIDIPVLKLKEISDKYDCPLENFFSNCELPSEMYRKIVKAPIPKKPDKEDAVFNEYMLDPANKKKNEILKAGYILYKNQMLIDIRLCIETLDADRAEQTKLLYLYFTKLSGLIEKQAVKNI